MSDWKIEATKVKAEDLTTHALLVDFLYATRAWRRLSKPAREAVEAAYPEEVVDAHGNTLSALLRHGFIEQGNECWWLTDAGRAVARWCVRGDAA